MGLFDSLKKDVLKNIKNSVPEDFLNLAKQAAPQKAQPQSAPQTQTSAPAYPEPVRQQAVPDQFPKFDAIITAHFSEYEVRRNLPARELLPECHPACTPVQFMFYKDGKPVLAVVLVKTNNYRGMNVLGTKKICDAMNIPYLRFYHEYENAEDYVVQRIREHL